MSKDFFIDEDSFKIWLPDVEFIKSSDNDQYNSRRISGIMSTERKDRQGEVLVAKGLDFSEFLSHGHFNDNHSQDTSAIVGYPEKAEYHSNLAKFDKKLNGVQGWSCEGYVLKGTKKADAIWELALALQGVPSRNLGFSVEGKVIRREDKTIEKANIRNVAITNCPVNTDCSWSVLEKSFYAPDMAIKAMSAGYGVSPATQSGGGALRTESLDSDEKKVSSMEKKKKAKLDALHKALDMDNLMNAVDIVLDKKPTWDVDAAAYLVAHLLRKGGKL
jgi:hypothetical protein